jgi:hypothetical protein
MIQVGKSGAGNPMMRAMLRLPTDQRWMLLRAALLVAGIRLALGVLPFPWVHQKVARRRRPVAMGARSLSARQIAWCVMAVGRRIPGSRCLAEALAADLLLARAGYPSRLRIGVERLVEGGLAAHAWVEVDGEAIVGDLDLERYRLLPDLPGYER